MSHISKRRKLGGREPERPQNPDVAEEAETSTEPPTTSPPPASLETQAEDTPSFSDLGIIPELCEACDQLGFKKPTPIQAQSIPVALEGRDVIGVAETGSGKTCAFALPILQALMENPSPLFGLVLAPTRELAYQISQQFEALGSVIGVRCVTVVGGMDNTAQAIALSRKPHIIVASPGRLMDHLQNTKGFSLRNLKFLVLDEADRLLDLDFGESINQILKQLPSERRTYLFSATMSSKVGNLQRAALKDPVRVSVSSQSHQLVSTLVPTWILIPANRKDEYLVYLLTIMFPGLSTIVFTRTKAKTAELRHLLHALELSVIPIHGDLSQEARMAALNKFKAKSKSILVATDVAARGLDIPAVDLVINYDLPDDSKSFVHKVGRTARAGRSGKAISLVTQYDVELWLRIEKALGRKLPELQGVVKEEVYFLSARVSEAQRAAKIQLKEDELKGKRKGGIGHGRKPMKGKRGREDRDRDEV